jgi:hypothetical protein
MKTVLVLIVIVIAVVVGYVLFRGDKSAPQFLVGDELSLLANHQGPIDSYDITLADNITVYDILGCYLPDSASSMHGHIDFTNFVWKGYVVADIPEDDFYSVVDKLSLVEKPNLADLWAEAFECSKDEFQYWDISDSTEGQIYYFEDQDVETYIAVKYIDGRMYFKRHTEYTFAQTDKNVLDFGEIRKLKKGEQRKPVGVKDP